ncbi:HAMP domain-containing sensor histidine kinase [Catenulispora subtropica]|uniref:histidine kinase n=1 Tax=Catenulispora subtropica TaxID=450798 RepID=A0ABN2S4K5_9ACTN
MTSARRNTRRSLQIRLALAYAAGIYVAGIIVLLLVDLPLAGVRSTVPVDRPAPATIAATGDGISPERLLVGSVLALVVLVPVALALGWFVAGRFLSPLRAITGTARAISAGTLDRRLDLGEPTDELTALGHTLDALFARLETAFDAQRHFVANASHELRTPLAGQRTLLEVALADPEADAGTLRAVCEEALALGEHQERLIHALLALAMSERGIARWEACDLALITRRILESRCEALAGKGITLTEQLAPAATVGDPELIERLVANVVDNAIRHNHQGGHVRIETGASGSWAGITVTNSGPLVPEDQLQRLLQPFQRLSPDREDGYGVGLAIVNAVAQAHRAALDISTRPEGGLTVTLRLPGKPLSSMNEGQTPVKNLVNLLGRR